MSMQRLILPATVSLALASGLATSADAQGEDPWRTTKIGNVHVSLDPDSIANGLALITPERAVDFPGRVLMACAGQPNGMAVGVDLRPWGREGLTREVVWHFDADEPRPTVLVGDKDSPYWILGAADAPVVANRARTAKRLVLRVGKGAAAVAYTYELTGLDSALVTLGCRPSDRVDEAPAGMAMLRAALPPDAVEPPRPVRNSGMALSRYMEEHYPSAHRRTPADVTVRMRILEDGTVDTLNVHVIASTHPAFDSVAVQAVRRMRFVPARAAGRPVKVWIEQPLAFRPSERGRRR